MNQASPEKPGWGVLSLAVGAFLLPLLCGYPSTESGLISDGDSPLSTIFGGFAAPMLTHVLVSLLFTVPILGAIFTRRILQVPRLKVAALLGTFCAILVLSILPSRFKVITAQAIMEWMLMASTFFAATLSAGRIHGRWVIVGLFAGFAVTGLLGLLEFGQMKAFDPGHRISSVFLGPNQAGIGFVAGICLGIPLLFTAERIWKVGVGVGILLMGMALWLTQSKGSILCLPIGLGVIVIGWRLVKRPKLGTGLASAAGLLLVSALLGSSITTLAVSQAGTKGGSTVSRFANSGETQEQSAGFRKLLWASSIRLTTQKPIGWGLGTFGHQSTRPGLVTQTKFAHQTFLQLAAEATVLAPLVLLAFLALVAYRGAKGVKALRSDSQQMLIGAYAATTALIAHNFIDSDMYVFALGASVFLLAGLITSMSADSQSLEIVFSAPRVGSGVGAALLLPIALLVGIAEFRRAEARGALAAGQPSAALEAATKALSLVPADGQSFALRGQLRNETSDLKSAAELEPTPKHLRLLATRYFEVGDSIRGFETLDRVREIDPYNAGALLLDAKWAAQVQNISRLRKIQSAIDAYEASNVFRVRSLPELVPTQSYEARLYLAGRESDPDIRARLLAEALRGFANYAKVTVPMVTKRIQLMPDISLGGESRKTIEEKLLKAQAALQELRALAAKNPERLNGVIVADYEAVLAIPSFEPPASER